MKTRTAMFSSFYSFDILDQFGPFSSFVHLHQMSILVLQSLTLISGPTRKWLVSEGRLCKRMVLIMWSLAYSGSPYSHAVLSVWPHVFMEALKRPTPVQRQFSSIQCRRGSCSRSTSFANSHSCFEELYKQVLKNMSPGMVPSILCGAR